MRSPWLAMLTLLTCAACAETPPATDAGAPRSPDAAADGSAADDATAASDSAADARTPTPQTVEARSTDGARIVVSTDPLRVRIERADGTTAVASVGGDSAIQLGIGNPTRWLDPIEPRAARWSPLAFGVSTDGSTITATDATGRTATLRVEAPAAGTLHLQVRAQASPDLALMRLDLASDDGAYHGLGELFERPDARGQIVPMYFGLGSEDSGTNEHHVPVPLLVSTKGYAVFVAQRTAGAFDVAATTPDRVRAVFEGTELDAWFFLDPDPRETTAMYARRFGLPRLPPRWVSAPMHWRNEWASRAVAEQDMADIRRLDIPCTTFWYDNPWQTSYNSLQWDTQRFPNPQEMLDRGRGQGFVPLVWSTPYLAVPNGAPQNEAERLFETARDAQLFVTLDGEVVASPSSPGQPGAPLDFTKPAAITFWQARAAMPVAMGVRGFKLDYGEDIVPGLLGGRPNWGSSAPNPRELSFLYSAGYHTPYRNALDADARGEGGFLLVRQAHWGGQTTADVIWPGDLDNDLRTGEGREVGGLPAAISALQSLSASGFPHFASDTGGYRGGMPTREVLLRWAEHTAWSPVLQLGGAGAHHNPWLYDDEAGRIYQRLARAHMDLVPYLRVLALRAHTTGYPTVHAPALAYPSDPGSRLDSFAYLLGEDVFVAPVYVPGATTRTLHLPPGTWQHFYTGRIYAGPMEITVDAPLGAPPVFLRQGALIPLGPPDLDTLVDADPAVVDPADRPYLRVLSIPSGMREVATEEGPTVRVVRDAQSVVVSVTPAATGVSDVRFEVRTGIAQPALAAVTEVRDGAAAIVESASDAAVRAGCDGVCWFEDAGVLVLSVRRATPTTVTIR